MCGIRGIYRAIHLLFCGSHYANYVRTFQVSFKFDVLFLSLAQFNLQVWGTHTFFHEFKDPGIQDDNIILLFM